MPANFSLALTAEFFVHLIIPIERSIRSSKVVRCVIIIFSFGIDSNMQGRFTIGSKPGPRSYLQVSAGRLLGSGNKCWLASKQKGRKNSLSCMLNPETYALKPAYNSYISR